MNHRSLRAALLSIALVALPASASAQSDAGVEGTAATAEAPPPTETPHADEVVAGPTVDTPPDTTTTVDQTVVPPPPADEPHTPTAVEVAAATPTASTTGASSAAPVVAIVAGIPIRVTGILWGSIFGSSGVESYGWANTSAPTSALNPLLLGTQANNPELSFQVQQSRFGLTLGEGTPFRGTFEIDFIHFDQQSSPTTQAFPRIRIAMLEWHFDANNRIFVGQGWDIFGNTNGSLLSHSANLVGTMFQAGNIGFMRQQLGWSGRFGDFEIALAVGMQGNNAGPTFNNLEESATPTGAARVMYHVTETSVFGISGIGTATRFTTAPDAMTGAVQDQRRLALGGELFGDLTFGIVNFHAEAYIAQNLANLGSLNLGQGRYGHDVADAGGYLSARITLSDWAITAMYGFAGLLNPSEAVPAYTTPPAVMGMAPPLSVSNTAAGPGMEWNMSGHVGVWYSPMHGLSFVIEPYFYYTRFVLFPTDALTTSANQFAAGGQFTTMFQF